MSEPSSEEPRGVLDRKPKTTIYTVLLLVALAALVISCLVMVLEMAQYGFQYNPLSMVWPAGSAATLDIQV